MTIAVPQGEGILKDHINYMPLQTYKGYFVDYRLRQFRSDVPYPKVIEFVDFKSEKGDALLCEMLQAKLVPKDKMQYCV